jgi:putative FmdB family regulatory protein
MPTYDYLCDGCEHGFELFQKVDDKIKKTCPECGKKQLRRLIGAGGGIIFKGSGFYQTDYRSSDYKKRQKEDSAPSPKEAEKKSDTSKPAKSKDGSKS